MASSTRPVPARGVALEQFDAGMAVMIDGARVVERGVRAREGARAGEVLMVTEPYFAVLRERYVDAVSCATFKTIARDDAIVMVHCGIRERGRASDGAFESVVDEWARLLAQSSRGTPAAEVRMAMGCLLRKRREDEGVIEKREYGLLGERGFAAIEALHEGVSARKDADGSDARRLDRVMEISSAGVVTAALMAGTMRKGVTEDDIECAMTAMKEKYGIDAKSCVKLLSILEANGFSITQGDGDPDRLGFGIYPDASLFNHSSRANAQVSFIGKTLVVLATRDIAAMEEVTISYCDNYMSQDWRRRNMLAGYGFDTYNAFGVENRKRADEARARAMSSASRRPLDGEVNDGHIEFGESVHPSWESSMSAMMREECKITDKKDCGLGVHVDLGEDVDWFAGELIPDRSLANDASWFALSHDGVDYDAGVGIMLVKADGGRKDMFVRKDDEIVTWGKFPPGVDRELTALNFAMACDIIFKLRMEIEEGAFEREDYSNSLPAAGESLAGENALMRLERVSEMLAGNGNDIAGVGSRHEVRKYLWLTMLPIVYLPGVSKTQRGLTMALGATNSLRILYASCEDTFSPYDSAYMCFVFSCFKLGQFVLHSDISTPGCDFTRVRSRVKNQILLYNELKTNMSKASAPGMEMHEEWAENYQVWGHDLEMFYKKFTRRK